MARKRKQPEPPEDEPIAAEASSSPPKRYPSRDRTKYLAVPASLYEMVKAYAEAQSDEDGKKSISWAARRLLRLGAAAEGFQPPKKS